MALEVPNAQLVFLTRLYPSVVVLYTWDKCPHCPGVIKRVEDALAQMQNHAEVLHVRYDEDPENVRKVTSSFPLLQKYKDGLLVTKDFRPKDAKDLMEFLSI